MGRSRQLKKKKQAHDLFFSSISLVTGSPRILCTRRLEGGGRVDFTPRETSVGSLKKPQNQIRKTPNEKTQHLLAPRRSGGHRMEPGFKRENVYKVEQDVGRVGRKKKNVSTSYIPLFFLAEPRRSSFPFLLPKKKIVFLLIHRKVWLGCFNLAYLGVLESLVFPPALPGAQVLGGDFLGAGEAGAEDAAAAAAPRGAVSAGEGGAAAGSGGSQALAPEGTNSRLVWGPPVPLPVVAGGRRGCPHELLAPTRLWRQEARVSSRCLFLRDSPRRAREPPRPPSALSWRSSPSAAAGGSPRRTQGLRGRALGGVAPAGWLAASGAALSGAASGPSEAPGWLCWRSSGTRSSVRRSASECARGSPPPARPPASASFPPPFTPPSPAPSRRRLLPAPPPHPSLRSAGSTAQWRARLRPRHVAV